MARQDPLFAKIEPQFILIDPRFIGLSTEAKLLYIYLWNLAVLERREILPSRYSPEVLSRYTGIPNASCWQCLEEIVQVKLIEIIKNNEGYKEIWVKGVKRKNKQITGWKDDEYVPRE